MLQITKATYLELFVFLCVMFQNSNRQHGFLCVYISTLLLMCIWWVQTNESRVWSSVLSLIHCLCTSQEHQSSHVSFFYTGTGAVKIRKIAFFAGGGGIQENFYNQFMIYNRLEILRITFESVCIYHIKFVQLPGEKNRYKCILNNFYFCSS